MCGCANLSDEWHGGCEEGEALEVRVLQLDTVPVLLHLLDRRHTPRDKADTLSTPFTHTPRPTQAPS